MFECKNPGAFVLEEPRFRKITSVFFVALVLFGYSIEDAMGMGQNDGAQIKEKFKKIDLADGVDEKEAIIIVQNALIESGDDKNCVISSAEVFAQNDPYWGKDSWHVSLRTTFRERIRSGLRWTVVNVDKKTGKMTPGGGGPDF